MMEKILWADYIKNKKSIALKVGIPLILVLGSYQFGYGNLSLVMIIIFTIITGTGLKIVQLKSNGIYNRLISAPITKKRLFLEIASVYIGLYYLQFLPAVLISTYYTNISVILISFLSIFIVVCIGILIGVHVKSLGQIHLISFFTVLPLGAVSVIPFSISFIFPFIYLTKSIITFEGMIFSTCVCIGLISLLLFDVSRL